MRIGQGFDAHRFAAGRPLLLGGVNIPHEFGLEAHSDGDVLIHALCDALLGAAGLRDIGTLFPDNDSSYRNIDSRILLRRVIAQVNERGWRLGNADITVMAQAPKLAPHIPAMIALLAADMNCRQEQLAVKATTTEGMGFTGRREGIAALAVVLLLAADDAA